MDTDPTKFEGASRPTKGSEDPQGEFAEHRRREELLDCFSRMSNRIRVVNLFEFPLLFLLRKRSALDIIKELSGEY